jgi:predicted PurR-regulated permease PerM
MLLPYLNTMILAAILAFLFSGVFERLTRTVRNRSLAAFLVTLLVLVTILIPLSFAGYQIVREAGGLYTYLREQSISSQFADTLERIQTGLRSKIPGLSVETADISARLQQALNWIIGHIGPLFAGISRLIINFLLLLLFFFYLVRDGGRIKRRLMDLSPLSDQQETAIFSRIGHAIAATVRGQLVIALLQGLVASIGFYLFGVPNPVLWGAVLMLTSFVPTIGTTLVQAPAIIYLYSSGQTQAAFGLAVWAIVAVGLLDNFLGPKLIASGTRMHPLVTLLAVLGGISLFGPIGILLGPIIISLLYALLDIYSALIHGKSLKKNTRRVWHASGM